MTALPIVTRELRVLARKSSVYWTRFGFALVATIVGVCVLTLAPALNAGAFMRQIVYSITTSIVGMYAFIVGMRNTADTISVENREGTLGLLFLTDLKGYDVVLGKLCSTGIHSIYGMLAAFPVFSIALLSGGIEVMEFVRLLLALLNVVFFAHAGGIAISSCTSNNRGALAGAVLMAVTFIWGLPVAVAGLVYADWVHTALWIAQLNPLNALHLSFSSSSFSSFLVGASPFGRVQIHFWPSLFLSHALGWTFLVFAFWRVPRCWQTAEVRTTWRARLQQQWHGSLEARTRFRRRLVSVNPFFWLASRTRFDPHITLTITIAGAAFIFGLFWKFGGLTELQPVAITITVILHLTIRILIGSNASRVLAEQRRSGGLEFLLSCTPLDTKDIVRGQWLALRRQFLAALVIILGIDATFVVANVIKAVTNGTTKNGLVEYLTFTAAMVLMLVADTLALGWVGMWTGVSARQQNRAAGEAISRVMLLPSALAFVVASLISAKYDDFNGWVWLWPWLTFGLAADGFLIWYSRRAIYRKFRILAATPYGEQLGFWAAFGRFFGNAVASMRNSRRKTPVAVPGK